MLNIVIPLAGKSIYLENSEYMFPKPLIEVNGKIMVQYIIENLNQIKQEKRFIFIVNNQDCNKYHLDNVLRLLTNDACEIIKLDQETNGATCSCLMAVDKLNNKDPLIITNADQIFEQNLEDIVRNFNDQDYDSAVISFESVHPRWSFARIDEFDRVVETAEKRPISKYAIAGFYYFKEGSYFINAAMKSIEKDAEVNGMFYIAPTINELILQGLSVGHYHIESTDFHTFYTPQKIKEYEYKKNQR